MNTGTTDTLQINPRIVMQAKDAIRIPKLNKKRTGQLAAQLKQMQGGKSYGAIRR